MRKNKRLRKEELLQPAATAGYEPSAYYGNFHYLTQGRPPFTAAVIAEMLIDPRVTYGLWLIKGPILSNAHVYVKCENEQVRQFVIQQINRFWNNSAVRALKAIEWGYAAAEVLYREIDGLIHFDELRDFHSPDVRVVVKDGEPVGVELRNSRGGIAAPVYLGFPKAFLHIHWRERSRYYGLSRLYSAHVPWWESWTEGGYRDVRRLWFYKNAFEGGTMRHPPGMTQTENGIPISNRDRARELIEKKRAGGVLVLPNTLSGDGGRYAWEYEPPVANPAPEGLLEYGAMLRDEILEALGIPPEVVVSSGNQGFGSSTGRQVPQMAFYAILQELLQWLLTDLDRCILRHLVRLNFGEDSARYDLLPFKLSDDLSAPSELNAKNYFGNQFQDENQRSVYMAFGNGRAFRSNGQWWIATGEGTAEPMPVAI